MTFVVTEQGRADLEKGRKKRERERLGHEVDEAATGAHAMAEGHRAAMDAEREAREDVGKASAYHDAGEGPARPMQPHEISGSDFTRGYLEAGHAADSPSNPGMPVRHVDLTASRGHLTMINPSAPSGPGSTR
jgi:hypothetical protein